jgi:hypothetical protein
VSALALAAMAVGNGIELYSVTARGTESDIGHTIFLIAFLILIAASILLGQILVRRRWRAGVRWAGLFLLLAAPLGIGFLILGGVLSPETSRLLVRAECPVRSRRGAPRSIRPTG